MRNGQEEDTMPRTAVALVTALLPTFSLTAGIAAMQEQFGGTPGESDCVGETTSALAKGGSRKTLYAEYSPQELKGVIVAYCAG
jgi:hypothetical protein